MTIVSINQPAYLAWEGYFDRIARSDIHVILDHVRMSKDGMFNRNKIPYRGKDFWLTVPIKNRGDDTPICDIQVAHDGKWQKRHWQVIKETYRDAPMWEKHSREFEFLFQLEAVHPMILMINTVIAINRYIFNEFGIKTKMFSSYGMKSRGEKSGLILNICKELGATTYLSGPFGREYLDIKAFNDAGIRVQFHEYPAGYSAIDALMHGRKIDKGVVKDE